MPNLVLTPGDPTGIGPEITVKALQRLAEFTDLKLTVIGSLKALDEASSSLKLPLPKTVTYEAIEAKLPGSVAYQALEKAAQLIADNKADALVTGPISKRNLIAADYQFHGHTEILEKLAHTIFDAKDARAEMLFVYKKLRMLLLTRHIALKDVPDALAKPGAIARPLKTLIAFLRHQLKISEPRIALLGVNPHIGEVGGSEEAQFLKPVINAVNNIGASILEGPYAADGFFRTLKVETNPYDAIVATYHDQGLIPFKMLAGYGAVNVTIGLPFIRTSVSHGTAEDIAGKGIAREDSLIAALHAAQEVL
ncbi:MAG: 4-hydroxythreonine-4-phosphate dehydrogenase PdxA [Alphaproteobacteria bacterium]